MAEGDDNTKDIKEFESKTYGMMLEEVETICRDVADARIDLDVMVAKVEQGYKLIKAMRTRLADTRVKIEELRVTME